MKPVIGVGMIGAGLLLVYGGITGRLAPMIAALFTPSLLYDKGAINQAIDNKLGGGGVSGFGGSIVPNIDPKDLFGPLGHFLG